MSMGGTGLSGEGKEAAKSQTTFHLKYPKFRSPDRSDSGKRDRESESAKNASKIISPQKRWKHFKVEKTGFFAFFR